MLAILKPAAARRFRTLGRLRFFSSTSSSSPPPPTYEDPNEPVVASLEAMRVAVEAGKTYRWCACGRSSTQPFCDGSSHLRSTIRPVVFTPTKSGTVSLCGCKHARRRPFCDGAHSFLRQAREGGGQGVKSGLW